MLNIEQFVPNIYINKSRDFQMYCKALEVITNNAKFNADSITNILDPRLCNNRMLPLLCSIYNYTPRKYISDHDLRLILENYVFMIKHKGTKKGIEAAISLTVKLAGYKLNWSYNILSVDNNGNPVHKVLVSIGGKYNKSYLHEFLNLVLPVGFLVEDSISEEVAASSQAVVTITTIDDVSTSSSVSTVSSLTDALTTKSKIQRVEVIPIE